MKSIQNFEGTVTAPNSDYPDGNIKDNTGGFNGTKVNKVNFADIFQFFAKLIRLTRTTPNNLPDNEYNGLQLVDSAMQLFRISKVENYVNNATPAFLVGNQRCHHVVYVSGIGGGGEIQLDWAEQNREEFDTIEIINASSNSVDITTFGGDEYIGGFGSNVYTLTLASLKKIKLVLLKDSYDSIDRLWLTTGKVAIT